MWVYDESVEKAGLDQKEVEKLSRRFQRVINDAQKMGLEIFGGSHSASFRFYDDHPRGLIITSFEGGNVSGGDGGARPDEEGFLRGE